MAGVVIVTYRHGGARGETPELRRVRLTGPKGRPLADEEIPVVHGAAQKLLNDVKAAAPRPGPGGTSFNGSVEAEYFDIDVSGDTPVAKVRK